MDFEILTSRKMYVRYVGTGVIWTILDTGWFYKGERDELTDEERELCEQGGGELPLRESVLLAAWENEDR